MITMPVRTRKPQFRSSVKTPSPIKGLPTLTETKTEPQEKLNKALISAANSGMLSKVEELTDKGADPHHRNNVGMRAIDYAKIHDYYRVVDFLEKEMKK